MSLVHLLKGDGYRFDDLFRGKVVDVNDPLRLGRVRVRVYPVMDEIKDEDLPWAEPCFPGFLVIPQVGNWVWVMFREGNVFKPVWLGWSIPFGEGRPIDYRAEVRYSDFDERNFIVRGMIAEVNAEYPGAIVLRHRSGARLVFYDSGRVVLDNVRGARVVLFENGNVLIEGKRIDLNP
ncbi:MAG: phage baseplate assembly protein V [Candidatus Bathyarchaeia archaeon]